MKIWNQQQEAENLSAKFTGVNKAKFARDFNVPGGASMLSQHISGHRPISLEAAIAYAKGLSCTLLEISPRLHFEIEKVNSLKLSEYHPIRELNQDIPVYANRITIKKYDEVGASMGKGIVLQDQPGQITNIEVTDEWVNKNVPSNSGKDNLKIVTGFGDSMKGMFNPGDPLLVDVGINSISELGDGVYFFSVDNEGFIKRLQRVPGEGIRVISQNKEYPMWVIKKDMNFRVLGKVLKVWESNNF
jgi:phage repressor protein C with HTH and peptisase S24 domain